MGRMVHLHLTKAWHQNIVHLQSRSGTYAAAHLEKLPHILHNHALLEASSGSYRARQNPSCTVHLYRCQTQELALGQHCALSHKNLR